MKNKTESAPPALELKTLPKYVGCYCLGGKSGMCVSFTKKPNFFHRTMMKVCLGWEWFDTTKTN